MMRLPNVIGSPNVMVPAVPLQEPITAESGVALFQVVCVVPDKIQFARGCVPISGAIGRGASSVRVPSQRGGPDTAEEGD